MFTSMKKRLLLLLLLLTLFICGCSAEPGGFEVKAGLDGETVVLDWETVEQAKYYRVFRKKADAGEFRFVCDLEGPGYTDKAVIPGDVLIYRVDAMAGNSVKCSAETETVKVMDTPDILYVNREDDGVCKAEWTGTGESFSVFGKTEDGDELICIVTSTNCLFEDPGGKYEAVAVSSDGSNKSSYAAIPDTPEIKSVTRLDGHVSVIIASQAKEGMKYELSRSDSENGVYTVLGVFDTAACYDKTTLKNVSYFYKVRLVNGDSFGCHSAPAAADTVPGTVEYIPVMMYHEFVTQGDLDAGVALDTYAVMQDEFEEDLVWLRDNGFSTVTTAQFADYLEGKGTLPDKPIILSIDDGKYGVYKRAWPILKKYGMTASLAVIGSRIDSATENPSQRSDDPAPYCTWDEIAEMAESGAIEIISHTYKLHVYNHDGRNGASTGENDTLDAFLPVAQKDASDIIKKINEVTGTKPCALAYPYSKRSELSDAAWFAAGFKLLLGGDMESIRINKFNPYVREAGLNVYSGLLRRIPRLRGVPISEYLINYPG